MSIRVALNHKTSYTYDRWVTLSPQVVRLRPAVHTRTPILAYSFNITPKNHFINWQQDPYGNYLARIVFLEKVKEFHIEVDLVADMVVINPFDFFLEDASTKYPFVYEPYLKEELAQYLQIKEDGEFLKEYIKEFDVTKRKTVDFLVDLNQKIHRDIDYIIRMEPGVQTCKETLTTRKGSCRDMTYLMVQVLRHLGLAARFCSGYLIQLTADIKALDGPSGPQNDFTDLHAWTEIYLPGAGWVGLDATSGLFAGEGHIPLAATPEPGSAAPVTGGVDKCKVEFFHAMQVSRLKEQPRVTKPFTEEEWTNIYLLGQKVDKDLLQKDIRLTMGGEPTFVSIDDMESAEWNIDAMGPNKKKYALELFYRIKNRFAYKPLLHFGQGKWYPGESLPRWALTCFWRKDKQCMWKNQSLFGDERIHLGYNGKQAELFIHLLSQYIGVTSESIQTGYEDLYYYLWKEGTLPVNVDPFKVNLKDEEDRKNLRKVLEQGLDKITGYALPIRWNYDNQCWETSNWVFKRDKMYLVPGDSPMGYRLPLKSILHSETEEYVGDLSSFRKDAPLGDFYSQPIQRHAQYFKISKQNQDNLLSNQVQMDNNTDSLIRSTLCVEPRKGNLYIFMPPVLYLEQYLDLLACIELTAEKLGLKVIIEGYMPPMDSRLEKMSITPDPGVIEVNIHPSHSWEELVHKTDVLYEEARYSRLGTEKFMMDGRHTGTGGGNHIVLGAEHPSDSPFLRNPQLLKSMLGYWLNHPSLSYLFSGLFIGPTSQSPRVDESRNDQIFELEVAFKELDKYTNPPFWLVDRILRNILVDLTGNTHRTEFCIDKLFSPAGSTGRLGLLELRPFEMPPHSKMSALQMLLVRAMVSMLWTNPYNQKLVRWGTELHDKYMLPHFLWKDLNDIILDLNSNEYNFELNWFESFYHFRFPFLGKIQINDIQIELRLALEPWNVLGEESSSWGTSRYVDSSAERLQIKVFGLTNTRYMITCNGKYLPLQKTDINGEYVAGIKYKAWNPESSLHPTIPSHSPIVIDIIDLWNLCSIGGCVYHVTHPGGTNYITFPINSNEAESRRISRFYPYGHIPGKKIIPVETVNPEFPYTLDLRK